MGKRSARALARFASRSSFHVVASNLNAREDALSEGQHDHRYIRHVKARTANQQALLEAMVHQAVTLALGPAGTGKTYLAVATAVRALEDGEVDRIILTRPAVEAGEHLGFLPGSMEEKLRPYLRAVYDVLTERLGGKRLKTMVAEGVIEIAPIAYMRGRTLNRAFVIVDEAQNCTYAQLKMLLTRLGWNSRMVVTGDPGQTDLLSGLSGLADIAERLQRVNGIAVVHLADDDVVRHPLVQSMLGAL